jgi:GH25 family lysozyme M1 (1,4-beta-N-acetylmuramidase)
MEIHPATELTREREHSMTIYGLDFSHYDAIADGARVVSEGFSFMTHKAGGDRDDAELAAWWRALKPQRGKVLLGAYWVLLPGSPVARADAFLARLDSQCLGWRDGPFILQLDCEDWDGTGARKPGKADIKAACDRLRSKMPKLRPIVYASAGQYGNQLTGLGYPLWNARYRLGTKVRTASGLYAESGGDGGAGWNSYSGQTPAIWQFTSSATAISQTTCDANAYRGTLDQLTALLAPGWVDDMAISDDVARIGDQIEYNRKVLGNIQLALQAIAAKVNADPVDEQEIITGVLAGLSAEAIAAAIPADIAQQVADVLAQRLAS